jgi:hypothetical protein
LPQFWSDVDPFFLPISARQLVNLASALAFNSRAVLDTLPTIRQGLRPHRRLLAI